MRLSVVLGQWLDRSLGADLEIAVAADRFGYRQLWVPEMAKADSPAMAASVAASTAQIELVLGPLAVTVRSPVGIAIAAQTVSATGRPTHIAIGTSSSTVARWHGRNRDGAAGRLEQTLDDVQILLDGGRVNGFRLSAPPVPRPTLTVAAFGPRAVAIAQRADRMVLNMVTVAAARRLAAQHSNTAVWLCAAIDPSDEERQWMARGFVGYLTAPGYDDMFIEAGYGELVEFARSHPGPKAVLDRIPLRLLDDVALVGDESTVQQRISDYAAVGIAEIGLVVPPLDLPCATRTLDALAR